MRLWIACLPLVLGPALAFSQDFDKVQIESSRVADGIYMLTGLGGNMAVSIGEDGVFLVDDQYAPLTPKIEAAIRKLSDQPIRFVINTHLHGDHTGGNENLGQAGATVVAHHHVRDRMSREQVNEIMNRRIPPSPRGALPLVTYEEEVVFHVNGHDIRVFHTDPAHTDGDSIVVFRGANVVHTGDTFMPGRFPFIDLSNGGSIDGFLRATDRLLALIDDDTKIIPGHGALATRAELQAFRDTIQVARDRVAGEIAKGRSLEQAVAANLLEEHAAEWGSGFINSERFVTFVYLSLKEASAGR